jgi:hypothetical protein
MFGWGKLKLAAITEQFGEPDALAARLALPVLATPVIPDVRGTPPAIDVEATVAPWLRLPAIEYGRALAALPAVVPRDWSPSSRGGAPLVGSSGQTNYIELAGVDVHETLTLAERVIAVLAPGGRG